MLCGNYIIAIKAMDPPFNPQEDFVESTLVWVKLPNLPMEFWSGLAIRELETSWGRPLWLIDDNYVGCLSHFFVKVLVDMDIRWGLYELVDLVRVERRCGQRLDHLNVPFRCVHCHDYSHVGKGHGMLMMRKVWCKMKLFMLGVKCRVIPIWDWRDVATTLGCQEVNMVAR